MTVDKVLKDTHFLWDNVSVNLFTNETYQIMKYSIS